MDQDKNRRNTGGLRNRQKRLPFLPLLLLPALFLGGWHYIPLAVERALYKQMIQEVDNIVRGVEALALHKNALARNLAVEASAEWGKNPAALRGLPARYVSSYPLATGMGLNGISEDRALIAAYAIREEGETREVELPAGNFEMPASAAPLEAPVRWTPFYVHPVTGIPTITAVCRIRADDGRALGVATADLNLTELQNFVTQQGLCRSLTLDILDENGWLLAGSRVFALGRSIRDTVGPGFQRALEEIFARPEGRSL